MEKPQKFKYTLAPATPLLGMYPKEMEAGTQTCMYLRWHNSQMVETTQTSIDERMGKPNVP